MAQTEPLRLFTTFHLNLAYSAIEEQNRREVVERCYWPLLRIARDHDLPIGFEASGYTIEEIARIDEEWVQEARSLVTEGRCEFVGSGYAQLIGPLVPAEVNARNLQIGLDTYEELLSTRPSVALVNEQAYAAGLVELYRDAGFDAIFTEWDNPYSRHPAWPEEWMYHPQRARGPNGSRIPVVWNNSIAFQKFQRYVHGEASLDDHLDYLSGHVSPGTRNLCLYGNDVEVFDFRPGRYHTEADLDALDEWDRIRDLFVGIDEDPRFELVTPSAVLNSLDHPEGGNTISLESTTDPIPVKKQRKYNLTRWAVTGRNDLAANTQCWQIYEALSASDEEDEEAWKELCHLWSSDFRTHITEDRWAGFRKRLASASHQHTSSGETAPVPNLPDDDAEEFERASVRREGNILTVERGAVKLSVNCRRGLAIDGLWFDHPEETPLCGTLPHGYFDDIGLGADWYTGHTIYETPGEPKITDLNRVEPVVWEDKDEAVFVAGDVPTRGGEIRKWLKIPPGDEAVEMGYRLSWDELPMGSLRLGHVTLHPETFDSRRLAFQTHNGGRQSETFPLQGAEIDHGSPVSFLVSGRAGVGLTEGPVTIGDHGRGLRIDVDKDLSALIGMVTYRDTADAYFCRLAFSALEMDETSRTRDEEAADLTARMRLTPWEGTG